MHLYPKPKRAAWLLADFKRFATVTNIIDKFQAQPHDEMFEEIVKCIPDFSGRRQHRKIYLTPRYTYKSSIAKAFIVYLILRFPDISIAIYRATRMLAKDMIASIQDILMNNPEILATFGNLSTGSKRWTTFSCTVNTRTKMGLVDPTVTSSGLKTSMAGSHPDFVLMDDIVTEVNCDSVADMDKAEKLVDSSYPVLPMWGSLLITGTEWSAIDAYWRIRKKNSDLVEAGKQPDFDEYIRKVYYTDDQGNQALFFPSYLTEEFLERQRETLPARWFAAWYFQEVRELGMAPFPREKLRFFDGEYQTAPFHQVIAHELGDEPIPVFTVLVVDPALTGAASSDDFGLNVIGFAENKRWLVLESQAFRKLPSDAGEILIALLRQYEPDVFLIETQNADVEMMARVSKFIHDTRLPTAIRSYSSLQDEPPGKRGKDQRILAMEPRVKRGMLCLRRGYCGPLLAQLDNYPSLVKDDCLDSLAMARKMEKWAPRTNKQGQVEEDDRERVDDFNARLDEYERDQRIGLAKLRSSAGGGLRGAWTGPLAGND